MASRSKLFRRSEEARSRAPGRPFGSFLAGLGFGSVLAYYLDPRLGRARRARAHDKSPSPYDKATIVLPPVPLNNAYVQAGTLGQPPIAVVPSYRAG